MLRILIFLAPGQGWSSLSLCTRIDPDARHALPGAVFHLSKMRAHVAADARVQAARCIFRGLGLGFQGLESKQPRSGSSATPYTHPEARHAPQKKSVTQIYFPYMDYMSIEYGFLGVASILFHSLINIPVSN